MVRSIGLGASGVVLAGSAVLLSACGGAQDDPVRAAADAFYGAVTAGEGAAACDVLAPVTRSELEQSSGTTCAEAVLAEGVPSVGEPRRVEVFGTMAQISYAGEVAFLTRFDDEWRVLAAACTPTPIRYDCSLQGA